MKKFNLVWMGREREGFICSSVAGELNKLGNCQGCWGVSFRLDRDTKQQSNNNNKKCSAERVVLLPDFPLTNCITVF